MSLATIAESAFQKLFVVKVAGKAVTQADSLQQKIVVTVLVGVALVFVLAFLWNGHRARRKAKRTRDTGGSAS